MSIRYDPKITRLGYRNIQQSTLSSNNNNNNNNNNNSKSSKKPASTTSHHNNNIVLDKTLTLSEKWNRFLSGRPGSQLDVSFGIRFITPTISLPLLLCFVVAIVINSIVSFRCYFYNNYRDSQNNHVLMLVMVGLILGYIHTLLVSLLQEKINAYYSTQYGHVLLGVMMAMMVGIVMYCKEYDMKVISHGPAEFVLSCYIGKALQLYTRVDIEGV